MHPRPSLGRLGRHAVAIALCCGVVSGPALLASPAQSARPAPTCHGHPATIVGSGEQGQSADGTDGDDVIVTNGNYGVDAGAGDDIVCITSERGDTGGDIDDDLVVDAGPGDDEVYIPQDQFGQYAYRTEVTLGTGADTFTSAGGRVTVLGADFQSADDERDDISSTAGSLTVEVGDGGVLDDHVSLGGPGQAILDADSMSPGALIETTSREASVTLGSETPGDWVIDNPAGQVTRDGVPQFRLEGFLSVSWDSTQPVDLIGGPSSERLSAVTVGDADLGGGNDLLESTLAGSDGLGAARRFAGGAGKDTLQILGVDDDDKPVGRVAVQHETGTAGTASLDGAASFPVTDFEKYHLFADRQVTFVGGDQPDQVKAIACHGTTSLHGGDGDDRLVTARNFSTASRYLYCFGDKATSEILGGNGDDIIVNLDEGDASIFGGRGADDVSGGPGDTTMKGGMGADVLTGGPGKDSADGAGGIDYCEAEKRSHCERGDT